MHHTSRLIKLAACLVFALTVTTTTAAASTSRGVLSQPEYQQLNSMFTHLKSVKGSSVHSVKTKLAICRRTKSVSALVADVKADCTGLIGVQLAAAGIEAVEKRCTSESSVAKGLNCLLPGYKTFYRSLETLYHGLQRLDRLNKQRGFSAGCVAVVGGSPTGVKTYGRIATDAGQVLSNLRSKNLTRLRAAEDRLFAAENVPADTGSGASLSVCTAAL